MFYIQVLLTNKCNQNCKYCDINDKNVIQTQEVDIDNLKWIIGNLPHDELIVELTGGEVGLCSNLVDVVEEIKREKRIKRLDVMSNGLVRLLHPELIREFDLYNEHLVRDIYFKRIEKFYEMGFSHEPNTKNVIVSTARTVTSLLENFDYFRVMGLFSEHFWHKLFVDRTMKFTHKKELVELYEKMYTNQSNYYVEKITKPINKKMQYFCSKHPWQPCVDLQRNKIIHCAYHQYNNQVEVDITKENLNRLVDNTLFNKDIKYCDTCYLYDEDYKRSFKGNR